jgi:hypothetical protein
MIRRAGIRRQIRREADYVLKTTIKTQYGTIADVLCRIYLPRSVMARPYLHFEPTPLAIEENPRVLENDQPIPFETPERLEEILRGFKISYWSRHSQSYFDEQVRGEIPTA